MFLDILTAVTCVCSSVKSMVNRYSQLATFFINMGIRSLHATRRVLAGVGKLITSEIEVDKR